MDNPDKQEILFKLLLHCGVSPRMVNAKLDGPMDMGSYFFTGKVGTGKTYAAVSLMADYMINSKIAYKIYEDGLVVFEKVEPIFITTPELLLNIRDCFGSNSLVTERQLINKYADTPFLILDDMGSEKISEFVLTTLYLIIDRRYNNPGNITIITSNLTLDGLSERFNDRIASRIAGMCKTIHFKGKDRRLYGK